MVKLILFLFIQLSVFRLSAQSILVTGKILDAETRNPIANATIKSGNFGTSSIKDGSFRMVLNKELTSNLGLTISCIGYETKTIAYKENLQIFLNPTNQVLGEVIVGVSGLSILEKAIQNIEKNYPQKDFTMEGFIKMHQIAKDDTADYKFYKNEAIVKVGVTPYKKTTPDSKVTIVQNKKLLLDSLKTEKEYVRFVNAYQLPINWDIVHRRDFLLSKSELKKYEYHLSTKTILNGRTTYVINFNTIKKKDSEGIIYIDSSSYAIAKINITSYDFQPANSIKIKESTRTVVYKMVDDKWYVKNISRNSKSEHNNINYTRFEEYHTIKIDSKKLDVNYVDVVQNRTEDLTLNKPLAVVDWNKYQPFIDSLAKLNLVSEITPPTKLKNFIQEKLTFEYRALNRLREYIISGGIKTVYGINQLPLLMNGFQPLINKDIPQTSNYNFSLGGQFRLHTNLFLETGGGFNFGIGGLRLTQNDYLLNYNFVFNKTHHPLTITPSFGYSNIDLSKKKEKFYYQESLLYRISFMYEKRRQLSYVISLTYVDPFYQRNNGLMVRNLKFAPRLGLIRSF